MKGTNYQGYKYTTFDEANNAVNQSVQELQKILDKAQNLIANECACVMKALINKGEDADSVHGFYFQAIQHCLIRHNPEKSNFTAFLRQKIQWLLDSKRANEARKKKQFDKIAKLKVYCSMHGEVMPVDQIGLMEAIKEIEEWDLEQTELEF